MCLVRPTILEFGGRRRPAAAIRLAAAVALWTCLAAGILGAFGGAQSSGDAGADGRVGDAATGGSVVSGGAGGRVGTGGGAAAAASESAVVGCSAELCSSDCPSALRRSCRRTHAWQARISGVDLARGRCRNDLRGLFAFGERPEAVLVATTAPMGEDSRTTGSPRRSERGGWLRRTSLDREEGDIARAGHPWGARPRTPSHRRRQRLRARASFLPRWPHHHARERTTPAVPRRIDRRGASNC